MAYFTGTLLASPIVRGSSGDTYGTHHSILSVGGYMEVNNISERNALPVDTVNGIGYDGISSGQRRIGMLVYVHSEDTIYQLYIPKTTWSGLTSIGKITTLADNTKWRVFVTGEETDQSGERIYKQFEQTTHGFVIGDVIGHDGTEFVKVTNITASNVEPLGIVTKVVDNNVFNLTFSGYISTSGIIDVNSSSLTGGTIYYLSNVAGKLTKTKPTGSTAIIKPMLVTLSGNTGIVLQYRGLYDSGVSGGTVSNDIFTGYTATTQEYLDKTITGATNLGYFTGTTGIQTLPINHLSDNSYDGNYVSVYNNYFRDSDGYIRIGSASDNVARRGYVKETTPIRSWIWNEYTGDSAPIGWIFINADINSSLIYDTKITGSSVNFSSPAYTGDSWSEGSFYNNGSQIIIDTVRGNLTTGSTYISGGPIYKDKINKNLRLRQIITDTPEYINIEHDDYYIRLSGSTPVSDTINVGSGIGVFSGTSGNTTVLKSLVGGGDVTIIDDGNQIVITTTGGETGASAEKVTKFIDQTAHGFSVGNAVGWKSGQYRKAIADGSFGKEVIGIVSNVPNSNQFELTQSGYVTGFTGLVTNSTYYVSPSVSGGITITKPTTIGYVERPILVADSTTSGWVLPYWGKEIETTTGGTTSLIYSGKTPTTCEVGGMTVGTTLTGRTISSILEEILVPTINPIYVAPSNSFSKSPTTSTYEVGCSVNLDFTASFDKGAINLSGSFQDYRSGDVNCYYYNGSGLPSTVSSTSLSNLQSVSSYVISAGTQTWNSCVGYDQGPQPLDSNGDPYGSPLSSGITSAKSTTITGIYPYYWGIVASGGAPAGSNRPSPTNNLVTGGTKVVATSNGTLNINFGSTSDDYLWFAIPSISTSKSCWYIDALNNGSIGGSVNPGGNLFPDPNTVAITSGEGCWSGINYKIYISNYQSAVSSIMELRN